MSDFVVDPFKTVKDQLDLNAFVIYGICVSLSRFCWELDAIPYQWYKVFWFSDLQNLNLLISFCKTSWFGGSSDHINYL